MTIDITSTHPYTDNHTDQLTTWLADTPHHFDLDGDLVIDTPDGEIHPRPGSWLIRWTDGEVTVASPRTAHRTYGPEGIAGRLQHAEAALTRVRAARDRIAHAPTHVDAIWCLDQLDAALAEPEPSDEAADKPAPANEQYRYATTWADYHAGRRAALNDRPGSTT
jgi:hypothetical protein